jgi:PKHD-type hydroxylase
LIATFADVLGTSELAAVRAELAGAQWRDGRKSAGVLAQRVKRNEERVEAADPGAAPSDAQRLIAMALERSELFRSFALPRRVLPVLFSRYGKGMEYGRHVDNAVLGTNPPLRTDVALTLFLSDPESYVGGELVVLTAAGEAEFKLPAGHAVVYPATFEHWVEPVREGERLAAVTWVQSLVRDAEARALLHDLQVVLARLLHADSDPDAALRISKAYANLLRRFADV